MRRPTRLVALRRQRTESGWPCKSGRRLAMDRLFGGLRERGGSPRSGGAVLGPPLARGGWRQAVSRCAGQRHRQAAHSADCSAHVPTQPRRSRARAAALHSRLQSAFPIGADPRSPSQLGRMAILPARFAAQALLATRARFHRDRRAWRARSDQAARVASNATVGSTTGGLSRTGQCPLPTSTESAFPDSPDLNYSNRPLRARMPGGVGGGSGQLTVPIPPISRYGARLKVADKAHDKRKDNMRELTHRTSGTRGVALVGAPRERLPGWKARLRSTEVLSTLHDLDQCGRRRLRCHFGKQSTEMGPSRLSGAAQTGHIRRRSVEGRHTADGGCRTSRPC